MPADTHEQMAALRKAGGHAFPKEAHASPGMTLRDWFAGQALGGLLTTEIWEGIDEPKLAARSYQLADLMLQERAK